MSLGTDVIKAALQEEGVGGVRNPLLKVLLVLLPFGVVFNEVLVRDGRGVPISPEQNLILLYCALMATVACVEHMCLTRFLRVVGGYGLLAVGVVVLIAGRETWALDITPKIVDVYNKIWVVSWLQPRTWIIILAILIAIRAVRNIHSRDALWLGRTLLAGWAFHAYMLFVVSHAVVYSVLFRRLSEALQVARGRYYLLANRDSRERRRARRLLDAFRVFLSVLGRSIEYVGDLIYSLAEERRFFEDDYKDAHATNYGQADVVAAAFLMAGVVMVTLVGAVAVRAVETVSTGVASLLSIRSCSPSPWA